MKKSFFHEGDPPRSVPPSPRRKKQRNIGGSLLGTSGAAAAQRPRTPLSPQCLMPQVCFRRKDQRPSLDPSGLVSFGASEEEITVDETMSLMTTRLTGPSLSVPELSSRSRLSSDSAYSTPLLDAFPKAVVNDDATGVTFR
ncbi:hypothetical protein G5714_007814 [Onychostoma macrolepis]|uniref:Uncharacterized protein n=1 Tax=Onychostoma macrolepis TaxID=369639 RepID=A0A7J6CW56_9TELE|nr:hypothetical protein G5714_007814 [Onychostoma macrolepis]